MMPIYEYQCKDGHLTEEILFPREYTRTRLCSEKDCEHKAERIFHSTREERWRMAQKSHPVVIHRDKNGNVRYPAHADAPLPAGFEKVEMHTLGEIHRFEQAENAKLSVESERFEEARYEQSEAQRKERHAALRAEMGKMPAYGRDFARVAMEHAMKSGPRNTDPGFHVEIAHYDQRERGEYRDERTGWKGERY